jgi:hypothetical protein
LAIHILSCLTRNRAELNTITSERTNEKLIEEIGEERNALTDANGITEEKWRTTRLEKVKNIPDEINPYVLPNDILSPSRMSDQFFEKNIFLIILDYI